MKLWQSDQELFELARRELFTAVVGDIMDTMGLQKQFLPREKTVRKAIESGMSAADAFKKFGIM